jgi:hypothetical protein
MSDDRPATAPPASEADTAQPNPPDKKSEGWQMPVPKFQQTSGYLPQGYLELAGMEGKPTAGPAASAAAPAMVAPGTAEIAVEPQPELAEQLENAPTVAPPNSPATKERSNATRLILIILGLLGMILFIAAFLGVVYYLFINPREGGSTF